MKSLKNPVQSLLFTILLAGCIEKDAEVTPETLLRDSIQEQKVTDARGEAAQRLTSWAPWSLTFESVDTMFASEAHMVELFGRESVTRGTINVGGGEKIPATVLFAEKPEMRLKMSWHKRKARQQPAQVVIEGSPSMWYMQSGLRTGITLDSLRRLNGRPFDLSGYDRDYGGTVMNWRGGKIEAMETDGAWLVVRTETTDSGRAGISKEDLDQIIGDRTISSENSTLQTVNPIVSTIILVFSPHPPPPAKISDSVEKPSAE